MKERLAKLAGTALLWRAVQLAGVKSIFLVRLLVLAYLLTPDDFGLLAIALTPIGFLLGVTDLGMVPALVQRPDVDERLYNAAWTVGLTRATIITVTIVLSAPLIANIFAEPRSVTIIRALAIIPLLDATASIKLAELVRDLKFRTLACVKLLEGLLNAVVAIVLASFWGVWALVAGALAGKIAHLIVSYILAPHRPRLALDLRVARPLIRFGRWIFLTGLLAVLGGAVLKVVISRQLGAIELGLYFLAARIAFLPAELASEVVGAVAFPIYSRLQSDLRQASQTFWAMLTGMATILLPVCALMIALAPSLVQDILGPRWHGTIPIVRVLALVGIVGLFGEAVVPILNGLGQPYRVAVLEAVQSLLLVAFVWTLAARYGIIGAALAWLPATAASQAVSILFANQILRQPFHGLKGSLIAIISASVLGAMVAFLVDKKLPGILGFVVANLIGLAVIGILLWMSDLWLDLGLGRGLSRTFPQVAALLGLSPVES